MTTAADREHRLAHQFNGQLAALNESLKQAQIQISDQF